MTLMINLGLPKSGTTTLHLAVKRAGLRAGHWRFGPPRQHIGRVMYRDYFAGRDPLERVGKFDVLTQVDYVGKTSSCWPQMDAALQRRIREHHPGIKFLLLTRDPDKVASSIVRWEDLRAKLELSGAPGLPPPHASERLAITEWIRGHYATVRDQYRDDPDFLELDISQPDAKARLQAFLGVSLSWWGVANRTSDLAKIAAE